MKETYVQTYVQMNVNVTVEDARMVDYMASEDGFDNRSAFVRRLIRQEWARRYGQPNPAVKVTGGQGAQIA